MRLRQENKLAAVSSKQNPERALAFYRQGLELNNKLIQQLILQQNSDKLSPMMQRFYWESVADLANKSNR